MEEITYKYFVAEGEAVALVMETTKSESSAHQERISALLKKYEADCLWGGSRSAAFAIGFLWTRPEDDWRAKPPMRENFLKPEVERSGDVMYACYKPDQRYKAGKAIKAELKAVGAFSYSDFISKVTGVDRMVFGTLDGRQVMCSTFGGRYKDTLVFRIPVGGDHDKEFTPPNGFREIKKSEFIAITEEAR
jgi:hypothetical protein